MNKSIYAGLRFWTLIYLGLPLVIFSLGWLREGIAFLMLVSFFWGMLINKDQFRSREISYPWRQIGLAFVGALIWAYISGMGGFLPQEDDYLKHNQLWQDLVELPWPIGYVYKGHSYALCYYVGYYLPGALLGKYLGFEAFQMGGFLWGMLGLWLILLWLLRLVKGPWVWIVLLFILFAGQDALWYLIVYVKNYLSDGTWPSWQWLEMGLPNIRGLAHKLPSHLGHVAWAPQHFIPGALLGFFILDSFGEKENYRFLPFLHALLLLWSPFLSLGLLFFSIPALWLSKQEYLGKIYLFLPAIFMGAIMGLFYLSHIDMDEKGWIWEGNGGTYWPIYLVFFSLLKFLPPLAVLFYKFQRGRGQVNLLWTLSAGLILPMFYFMGHANDFYMRICLPAWLILSVLIIRQVFDRDVKPWVARFFLIWCLGAGLVPIAKLIRLGKEISGERGNFVETRAEKDKNFIQIKEVYLDRGLVGKDTLWDQYVGHPDAFFFEYLGKPLNFDQPKSPEKAKGVDKEKREDE